jgi:hypothetical protein
MWMGKQHPYFYPLFGGIFLVFALLIVGSLISSFWLDYWWKISLSLLGLGGLAVIYFRIALFSFVKEYENNIKS